MPRRSPRRTSTLRLLTLNAENLFSPGHVFYGAEHSRAEYREKIEWIASRIAECEVQIAGLVEIGDDARTVLRDLTRSLARRDRTGWPRFSHAFLAEPGPATPRLRNLLLSRFPLIATASLSRYPEGFSVDLHGRATGEPERWVSVPFAGFTRPVAVARVKPPGRTRALTVLLVHLRSKRPMLRERDAGNEALGIARSAVQRHLEAAALRSVLDRFLPAEAARGLGTVVLGDFNDSPSSVVLECIRGPFDAEPGPSSPWCEADQRRLICCARLHLSRGAHEDKLYSYIHEGSYALLDQVLVSQGLVSRFRRLEVHNDHLARQPAREETALARQWKSRASDHGIVVVELAGT